VPDDTRTQYLSDPVQITLALQRHLLDAWPQPVTVAQLLASLRDDMQLRAALDDREASRDQVYRGLANLAAQGAAEEAAGGWLPGTQLTTAAERLRQRIAHLVHRYLPQETAHP